MPIIVIRLVVGAGLLWLGYSVGREVGRLESVREELRRARETRVGRVVVSPAANRPAAG